MILNILTLTDFYTLPLFTHPAAHTASLALGKIQKWLVGRYFGNWIKILFFERFCSKPIITPAYYIMADWPDWTVPYNGEFYFLNRAKNDINSLWVLYSMMTPNRNWSPNWTANDPKIIGMAWTQVSGSSCQFYCNLKKTVKVKFCFSNEKYIQDFVQ